jgi:hypothetical protein
LKVPIGLELCDVACAKSLGFILGVPEYGCMGEDLGIRPGGDTVREGRLRSADGFEDCAVFGTDFGWEVVDSLLVGGWGILGGVLKEQDLDFEALRWLGGTSLDVFRLPIWCGACPCGRRRS